MNLKKVLLSLTTILVFAIFVAVQGTAYAEEQQRYMGVIPLMEHNEPHMGYSIGEAEQNNAATIWNIVKYKSLDINSGYENGNYYCLKSGVGFPTTTTTSDGTKRDPKLYNVSFDMKTKRSDIKNQNETLKGIVTGEVGEINGYDAILAVLDSLYLPGKSTEEDRKELIYTILQYAAHNAEKYNDYYSIGKAFGVEGREGITDLIKANSPSNYELTDYALTENEIRAVQQAVLWYFTNYGEEKFDKTIDKGKTAWLRYTTDGNSYLPLSNYELDFTSLRRANRKRKL